MTYYDATKIEFVMALTRARDMSDKIKQNVTNPSDLNDRAYYYLHADGQSGFGLLPNMDGYGYDLVALWSLIPGRGDAMLDYAQSLGATTLDCFDGFLVNYYAVRGWLEYAREKNWTPGEPDVVFMSRN